jgi:hypothetical protein
VSSIRQYSTYLAAYVVFVVAMGLLWVGVVTPSWRSIDDDPRRLFLQKWKQQQQQ